MKCPNCQSENSDTAKFCKKCGTALNTESAPNSHESMVKSMNEHKSQNNNTKIIIVALVIVAVVLAGAFVYMFTSGNSASNSANHADSASQNTSKVDTSDDDEPATASKTSDSSSSKSSSSSMTIKGGSFSTGSADADKTYASINVGKEHAGESVIVQIFYSRDGNSLNNGNMVPAHVHDDGYLYITSADAYLYYPDYATIKLYDSNSNLLDTQSVSLAATSGTQTF